jgi:hypothetical protein
LEIEDLALVENAEEALRYLQLAANAEKGGDSNLAASYFRKAYKLNPLLEEIEY